MSRLTKQWGKDNSNCVATELDYLLIDLRDNEFFALERIIRKLAYYENLEESGKLVELPCRVGDTLYLLDHECSEGMKYNCEIDGIMEGYLCRNCGTYPCTLHPSIQQVEVKNITIMKENKMIIEFTDLRDVIIEDFGIKVFLTRNEAELKLKGME